MELRQKEGDDAFHPSIEYFLGNVILTTNSLSQLKQISVWKKCLIPDNNSISFFVS